MNRIRTIIIALLTTVLLAIPTVAAGAHEPALPDVAYSIRWCESGDVYTAENPISSASGGWQFIDSTWTEVTGLTPPASAWPEHVQDAAFLELWDDGNGASHWFASRGCWEPMSPGWRTAGESAGRDCADWERSARGYCPVDVGQHAAEVGWGWLVDRCWPVPPSAVLLAC